MDPFRRITTLAKSDYPYLLRQIPRLPDSMDMIGSMPPETHKFLCVIGSRDHSSYGKDACEQLIAGLAGYPIVIVSGLAIGIDSIAHEAALKAGLSTIAFPGSGLEKSVLYPSQHIGLAERIVQAGGALLSPFKRDQVGAYWAFPTRNKLMAGISHATLVIEAKRGSGSLITANDASAFNRDLLAVPNSIFSPASFGSNELLRDGGIAVTSSRDILEALGFDEDDIAGQGTLSLYGTDDPALGKSLSLSADERKVLENMTAPIERDELIRLLDFPTGYANALLIGLELKEVIVERQGLLMID